MASTKYTYNAEVDAPRLTQEIQNSEITIALDYIDVEGEGSGSSVDVWFKDELPTETGNDQEAILDDIIDNHIPDPLVDETIRNVNIQLSNKYQLDLITPVDNMPKVTWTSVYSYIGSGYLWSVWIDVNASMIDFKLILDSNESIVPEINLDNVSGFGGSGQAVMLPLVLLGNYNYAFTPQEKIKFNNKVEFFLKTNDSASGTKNLLNGYIALVKEN